MRLFVAVDVPVTIKDAIDSGIVDALRPELPEARWTRPEGRHLTLKFLGEVDEDRVPMVGTAVREAVASRRSFDAAFAEIGGFPKLRRPRVLWLGIGPGAHAMVALAGDVERAVEPLGFPREDRPFTAHFTLARFPRPKTIGELPAVDVPDAPFRVDGVVLFRSHLHPKGARYAALEVFPLK